jgi:hypothetical protein
MSPGEALPEFNDFEEVNNMLAERVTNWTAQFVQQGMQQGMQQGEIALLERQLTKRFGPLSEETRTRLQTATREQLDLWAERILDANTPDEIFQDQP